MNKNFYNLGGELNSFNEGGKHSQNPLGGIPQGIGQNGQPNLVEQGETSFESKDGKYIFSDNINTKKDLVAEFNLPNYIKGKTFSKASEAINKRFKDRNDNASLKTKEELLDRLQQAQEYVKMQSALANNSQEVPDNMNGQIPEGMNEFSAGGIMSGISGGIEMLGNLSGKGVSTDPLAAGASGALSGAMAGGSIVPGIGHAIGGGLGLITSLIGSGKAKNAQLNQERIQTQSHRNNNLNTFELGGPITGSKLYSGIDTMRGSMRVDPVSNLKMNPLDTSLFSKPTNSLELTSTTPIGYEEASGFSKLKNSLGIAGGDTISAIGKGLKSTGNFLNDNKEGIMRLAPVATNALQLANLDKPEYETRDRINSRYNKNYVDEMSLQNKVTNEYNNTSDALANASGGNTSSLRASLLGAQLNKSKAMSDAYMKASDVNRGEDNKAQQFDNMNDKFNINQSNLEKDVNARNEGAYNTEKSKLINKLGENIGDIGKESSQMKSIAEMFGYSWDGKYIKDDDGNIIDPKTLKKKGNGFNDKLKGFKLDKGETSFKPLDLGNAIKNYKR